MSPAVENKKRKKPFLWLVQLLMLSRIFFIIAALVFAVILWRQNTNKLLTSINTLSLVNPNIELLEQGIKNLYEAENDFRYYIATYNNEYFTEYTKKIKTVSHLFDTLQNSLYKNKSNPSSFDSIFSQKLEAGNVFINIKKSIDSLLNISTQWDTTRPRVIETPQFATNKIKKFRTQLERIDTLMNVKDIENNKALISVNWDRFRKRNAKKVESESQIVKHSQAMTDSIMDYQAEYMNSLDKSLAYDIQKFYSEHINKYTSGQSRLNKQEMEIVKLNSLLITELEGILRLIKKNEVDATKQLKSLSASVAGRSARVISILAVISFIFASILFLLIIINLRKLEVYTEKLNTEQENAEALLSLKNRILANLNSQIRRQLAKIIGFNEQINQSEISNEQTQYTHAIAQASDKLLFMSDQMTSYMALEVKTLHFEKKSFYPYKVLQQVAASFLLQAKSKKLNLYVHILENDKLQVEGDEKQFKQLIVNLIDNAIKFTPKGEITIKAASNQLIDNKTAITFDVHDTGIGIHEKYHEKVFDPFFQVAHNGNGTIVDGSGLGLTICKMLASQQDGSIHLTSLPSVGTVVTVSIPYETSVISGNKPNIAAVVKSESPDETINQKVLLLDEDKQDQMLLKSVLEKKSLQVDTASSVSEGLTLFDDRLYSTVLIDTSLPTLDIIGMIKTMRRNRISLKSGIRIILLTNNILEQNNEAWKNVEYNHFLLKPFKESEIVKIFPALRNEKNRLS